MDTDFTHEVDDRCDTRTELVRNVATNDPDSNIHEVAEDHADMTNNALVQKKKYAEYRLIERIRASAAWKW